MDNQIYWALREEILSNAEQENSLTQFVYTTVVGALGLAITTDNCWLAFIALFAILPMSLRIADIRYSIAYIASYLKTNLESGDNLSWESMHLKFANKYSKASLESFIYNACRVDFGILTLISSVLFWFIHGPSLVKDSIWLTIVVAISQISIISFESFLGIKYANLKNLKNNLIIKWEHLNGSTSVEE